MSDTRHTPLPWRVETLKDSHGVYAHNFWDSAGYSVGAFWPNSRGKDAHKLIHQAVNARPKVEELVGRMLQFVAPNGGFIIEPTLAEWKQLLEKSREVEAALKGEA